MTITKDEVTALIDTYYADRRRLAYSDKARSNHRWNHARSRAIESRSVLIQAYEKLTGERRRNQAGMSDDEYVTQIVFEVGTDAQKTRSWSPLS